MEPCFKAITRKMLENHIDNSHQESELKEILNKLNIALLQPKPPTKRWKKYNRRNRKLQHRIGIISKLLGIPEPNSDVASSNSFNPDGFNPDAVIPDAVNSDAVNPDDVNLDAIDPEPVNPDAAHPIFMH